MSVAVLDRAQLTIHLYVQDVVNLESTIMKLERRNAGRAIQPANMASFF